MSNKGARHDAKTEGLATYSTGRPCPKGHIAPRRTHNGQCTECERLRKEARYIENKAPELERARRFRESNREVIRAKAVERYWSNPELHRQRAKDYKLARSLSGNPVVSSYESRKSYYEDYYAKNKSKIATRSRSYRIENSKVYRAACANRRAAKLGATPAWADLDAIASIYAKQAEFKKVGIALHVDHIIPLRGKGVCGLHVHWNLRLIPPADNCIKSARYDQRDALAHF